MKALNSRPSKGTNLYDRIWIPATAGCIAVALLGSVSDAATLSHAPMVGAVSDRTARIWIRADGAASAFVQYQLQGGAWSQPLQSPPIGLIAANDFTATFDLTGLAAATTYDYRIVLDGNPAAASIATFKTLPSVGAPGKFSFVFGADIHPGSAPHTPFAIIATEQADFAMLLGDQVYHTVDGGTEAEFWSLYKNNRDSFFQNFARSTPVFTIWDDGDYGADSGDSSYPWKTLARAAFEKYWANPPYVEQNAAVYYKFSVADVDFFMLDSRWGRIPGVTLLGAAQLQWLKDQLLASTARFKFIVSPVMVGDFGTTGADSWRGFTAERSNIFQHITANNIKNVIFLSGDQHWAGAFLINYPVFQIGHGIQGFYEIEPTPLSAFKLGAPRQNDPQSLFQAGG
jgi:alkaline phosphatase D